MEDWLIIAQNIIIACASLLGAWIGASKYFEYKHSLKLEKRKLCFEVNRRLRDFIFFTKNMVLAIDENQKYRATWINNIFSKSGTDKLSYSMTDFELIIDDKKLKKELNFFNNKHEQMSRMLIKYLSMAEKGIEISPNGKEVYITNEDYEVFNNLVKELGQSYQRIKKRIRGKHLK